MRLLTSINRTPLSPLVAFPVLWVLGALLSQIHLLNVQTNWSWQMFAVAASVPLAFVAGGLIGSGAGYLTRVNLRGYFKRLSEDRARLLLATCLMIGFAELVHQFVKIGGVPLISPDGNTIRFLQGGPTVVLVNFLTIAGLIGFVRPERLLSRDSFFDLCVFLVAMGGFLLQAGRGSLALMIVVGVAARWLYWGRPRFSFLISAGIAVLAVISIVFYLRARQMSYLAFEDELFASVMPKIPVPLLPLLPVYVAVTTNFYALQGIVGSFPDIYPYAGGSYSAIGLDLFLPGAANIQDFSASVTPPRVTATIAGSLWADAGIMGVILGLIASGALSVFVFVRARITGSLGWCLAAAYLLYVTIFGLYTNLWTQQIDWLMVTPLLLVFGIVADRRDAEENGEGNPKENLDKITDKPDPKDDGKLDPGDTGESSRREAAKKWIIAGIVAILALSAVGLVIQKLVPSPLAGEGTSVAPPSLQSTRLLMTDGDSGSDNEPIYWLSRSRKGFTLFQRSPISDSPGRRLRDLPFTTTRGRFYDIGQWDSWKGASLFQFNPANDSLGVTVLPVDPALGDPVEFTAPVAKTPNEFTQYFIATLTGPQPDLYVLTRGSEGSRAEVRVFSGESGFTSLILDGRLPYQNLQPHLWSVDVGNVTRANSREARNETPDFMLVLHSPERDHPNVQIVTGDSGFTEIAYRRDIDAPNSETTTFLLGYRQSLPSVYAAWSEDDKTKLDAFNLEPVAVLP